MKYVIITVDTDGDNLWAWKDGEKITTENVRFIPRFQEICENYGYYPTYLTNYEMMMDDRWVSYGKEKQKQGLCEIGMHLHAWNTPPIIPLENRFGGKSYITEYSKEVIEKKVKTMAEGLAYRFECDVVSNRSGRWAINDYYLQIIREYGIKVDCSVTPGLDLSKIPGCSKNCGNDYSKYKQESFEIIEGLLEVPMTTMITRFPASGTAKQRLKTLIKGESLWLRPIIDDKKLKYLSQKKLQTCDFVEFMIHSSELMPGGSPYFPNSESVEQLYKRIESLFHYYSGMGMKGVTLTNYLNLKEK